ncbi:hypothetical protein D041_3929A, partial [Vibrio parahaemolyticus EKP-008]
MIFTFGFADFDLRANAI